MQFTKWVLVVMLGKIAFVSTSLGSERKEHLSEITLAELRSAFAPTHTIAGVADLSLFSSDVETVWSRIPPRNVKSDQDAAALVRSAIGTYKRLGGLVIVDSGAPHSIAIATELEIAGWDPVLKMAATPGELLTEIQPIVAMKHYYGKMLEARKNLPQGAPMALIMDVHRNDPPLTVIADSNLYGIWEKEKALSGDFYRPASYPTIKEIRQKYKGRIIWVTEGEVNEVEEVDPKTLLVPKSYGRADFLKPYADAGIVIYNHRADPYVNGRQGTLYIDLLPDPQTALD